MKFAGRPLLLVILDGWGMPEHGPADALSLAQTPVYDRLWAEYPHTTLAASGLDVGLPEGQMGDSEVGHMNIGAGRVVYQDFTHISREIAEGSFFYNPAFLEAFENAKHPGRALHLFGLVSNGGIHSHIDHLFSLLRMAKQHQVKRLFVHCFTDGRDTYTESAMEFIQPLEELMQQLGVGKIATVTGRFYGMDRDKRWNRVQRAYDAMVYGVGKKVTSAEQAVVESYAEEVYDEFIMPCVVTDADGQPVGSVKSGDSMLFFNYRSDRAREISHAFTDKSFDFFDRGENPPKTHFVTLTSYDDTLRNVSVAYPPHPPFNTLGRVLSRNGLRQLRIAETEKYAHVTFFFNGGVEEPYNGEDRALIPSPKVATYDLKPEMSAYEVADEAVKRIDSGKYDVIILNFANCDMVGHTGIFEAAVAAMEAVDKCVEKVCDAVLSKGGVVLLTADHGNADQMYEPDGSPFTAHTVNPVPFVIAGYPCSLRDDAVLADLTPTMLDIMGITKPAEMTGESIINRP